MVAKSTSKKSVTDEYIKDVINKPQVFFSANPKITEKSIALTKHLYDTAKQYEVQTMSPFTELLTEGFDQDQIWEELASQNEPFLRYCKTAIKQWSKPSSWLKKDSTTKDSFSSSEYSSAGEEEELADYGMEGEENFSDMDMDDDHENTFNSKESEEEIDNNDNDDGDEEEEEEEEEEDINDIDDEEEDDDDEIVDKHLSTSTKTSEVDDDFFNLDAFNKWTDEQEAIDMQSDRESDDDDDDIDFDNDLDAIEDEEDDIDEEDAADITYKDFFLPPTKTKKQVKFTGKNTYNDDQNMDDQSENEFMDDNEIEEEGDDDDDQPVKTKGLFDDEDEGEEEGESKKTAHQRQLERVQAQIEQFEQENLEGRHWTLKGEASAKARPVNSLLEEDLEFDHSVKPVPVITQETTNELEEMIKKRIADDNFDDVERKEDPTLRPFLPSKRVELVDTQSKKSLADLYEEEYVKKNTGDQSNAKDEALEKEHNEISTMFQDLCEKLDALSNFHFTPKQAKAEMTIVSNAASISMEEIIPVNVSDATLLAPEEVYDKKRGEVKDKSEMDQDERKRERKQKKLMKRKERALKEKERQLIEKSKPAGSLSSKESRQTKTKAVKELLGQKNVTVIGKDGKKLKQDKVITSASLF